MNDRIAFYNAICADPENDAPRLVFADWLDEHGEPERAEFIRTQTTLAHLTEADEEYWTLGDREHALLAASGDAWEPAWVAALQVGLGFERGFSRVFRLDSTAFLAEADQIATGEPVESIRLDVRLHDWGALADCPALSRIGYLTLSDSEGDFEQRFAVLTSPHLAHLTRLVLNGPMGRGDLERLVSWPGLARFTELTLSGEGLQPTDFRLLADSPHVARLRWLNAFNLAPEADGSCPLVSSPNLRSLESLTLGSAFDTPASLHLAASIDLPSLNSLTLHPNRFGTEAISALARCPGLRRLRKLHASLVAAAIPVMIGPWLDNVADLSLSVGQLGVANVTPLASAKLPALRCLRLADNWIGPTGCELLARSSWAPNLRLLDLRGCRIGDEGLLALARAPLRSLRSLNLESNILSDAGLVELLEADWLGELRELRLAGNFSLHNAFAKTLAALPGPLRLRTLTLDIDPDGFASRALRERFGEWNFPR